jgi:hypothetical protein
MKEDGQTNKRNVYLPSLKIKVPDHVYVFRDTYTCYTYSCYAYHFTRIGCTLLTCDMYYYNTMRLIVWRLLSLSRFPHSFLQQATPHIRLRNVFQGQRCEKQRNELWRHNITARLARSQGYTEYTPEKRHTHIKMDITEFCFVIYTSVNCRTYVAFWLINFSVYPWSILNNVPSYHKALCVSDVIVNQ